MPFYLGSELNNWLITQLLGLVPMSFYLGSEPPVFNFDTSFLGTLRTCNTLLLD